MTLLSDNDLLIKLAAWDLLAEIPTAVGNGSVVVLDSFVAQLRDTSHEWYTKYGTSVMNRAVTFVETARTVGNDVDIVEASSLRQIRPRPGNPKQKIDIGEAILFAATKGHDTFRVLTGDKNCLYALNRTDVPLCVTVADRLRGKVVHFEQVIHRICESKGHAFVARRVRGFPNVDLAVSGAFGLRERNASDTTLTVLRNSIRQLNADCGNLLDLSETERPPW